MHLFLDLLQVSQSLDRDYLVTLMITFTLAFTVKTATLSQTVLQGALA